MEQKEKLENILVLESIIEANIMENILTEEKIPFFIREWRDPSYDGIFIEQKGYGWLMASRSDAKRIRHIHADIIKSVINPS